MSEDPLALYSIASTMPSSEPLPSENDYEAICEAVMETGRGRWFLAEYARRNRHADTKVVLSAIERIESMIRGDTVAPPTDRFRDHLADMAKAIARTKMEIAAIRPEAEQNGKILEASEELDSIVHTTEKATSRILAAAEQVQEIAWTVREQDLAAPICDQLDALATDIYTACSFQDLTGQRIQKVVQAMRYLEERINTMIDIWDDDVSAQAGAKPKTEAAPSTAAAAAASHPVHHDVAQDDLDQTDVDMVMDPAQQETAVKAEHTGRVIIDHEPLADAPAEQPQAVAQTEAVMPPEALVAQPEAAATFDAAPETSTQEDLRENLAPEGLVLESYAEDGVTSDSVASEARADDRFAAAVPFAESRLPEELSVDSIAMAEPVEAAPTEAAEVSSTDMQAVDTTAADTTTAEVPATDVAQAAQPDEVPAFFRPMVAAEPAPEAKLAPKTAPEAAPETTPEPETDLAPTIAAVREALFGAFPGVARPKTEDAAPATEPAPGVVDEPAADIAAPTAEAPHPAMALAGPAEFLLEPLSLPALRALSVVTPFSDLEHTETEPLAVANVGQAAERATDAFESPDVDVVEAAADTFTHDLAALETDRTETGRIETGRIAAGHIEIVEAVELTDAPADEAASDAANVSAAAPTTFERETAAIEAISPSSADEDDRSADRFTDAEAVEPEEFESAPIAATPDAGIDTIAPERTAADGAPEAIDIEILDVAEVEAVAITPMTPDAVADDMAEETRHQTAASAETEDTPVDSAPPEEADRAPPQPTYRVTIPDVAFSTLEPIVVPVSLEPVGERFAAAATAAPSRAEFIPFGYAAPDRPAAMMGEPYAVDAEAPEAGTLHFEMPADPLAAIMALSDDEKVALFS